jgi:toxin ParE1/3/4
LQDLATTGPTLAGVAARNDIAPGLLTLPVARKQRRGRHFALFRVAASDTRTIDVLRILHDAMDLPRHLPAEAHPKADSSDTDRAR